MAKISILMATTDAKIKGNSSFLHLPFSEECTAVVINQQIHNLEDLEIDHPFIKVVNSQERGISRSRNLALQNASSDYVHFCDDDLSFVENYFSILKCQIEKYPQTDFFQFQIETPTGTPYKKYTPKPYRLYRPTLSQKKKILTTSSVEIVANRESINSHHLSFNTDFGVGSGKFPMGEETLFLLDALEKNCSIQYIPIPLVIHPQESSGKVLKQPQLETLGILFQRVFGNWSTLFEGYYAFKKRKLLAQNNIQMSQAFNWMKNIKE